MIGIYARRSKRRLFGNILARAVGAKVYTPDSRAPRVGTKLVNWGCSATHKDMPAVEWLGNTPTAVAILSQKLAMFRKFAEHNIPCLEWTNNRGDALGWQRDGHIVYVRKVLQGHSGEGIERVLPGGRMVDAPLYTKAISGMFREYRVHVFDSKVIATQIKRRMSPKKMAADGIVPPQGEVRSAIRTYANGWVFCVNNVKLSDEAKEIAVSAINACGGVAGCTDLLVKPNGDVVVIETNSAPALRSPTVKQAYADAILEAANGR